MFSPDDSDEEYITHDKDNDSGDEAVLMDVLYEPNLHDRAKLIDYPSSNVVWCGCDNAS